MKLFMAAVSGFAFMLTIFAGGVATAIYFLSAEPVQVRPANADVTDVWTNSPVKVNASMQSFERIAARPVTADDGSPPAEEVASVETEAASEETEEELIDMTVTGSIGEEFETEPEAPVMSSAHVEWCSSRYRSYRPEDNRYTAYSGAQRTCVSPYLDQAAANSPSSPAQAASYRVADERTATMSASADLGGNSHFSADHIASCFARYRSYRPEDNSYQPYGGGPRRQCR